LLQNSIGENNLVASNHPGFFMESYIGKEAEVIVCTDNKQMKVGAKRNLLLKAASGEYVSFIDDDDMVSVDYVSELLNATKSKADVIVFDVMRYENGNPDRPVSYSRNFSRDYSKKSRHFRIPNHLMCFKKEIALKAGFPEVNFGEDSEFAKRALPLIKTGHTIFKTLYEYWFDNSITETQKG
jgi:glycosyltransferase involved in cell wall biosynthesis